MGFWGLCLLLSPLGWTLDAVCNGLRLLSAHLPPDFGLYWLWIHRFSGLSGGELLLNPLVWALTGPVVWSVPPDRWRQVGRWLWQYATFWVRGQA